jgi:hypothetical protein
MLIRSQDREILINLNTLAGIEITKGPVKTTITSYTTGCIYLLGEYSTKEKAMKVLDMIQEAYCKFMSVKNDDAWSGKESVFYMPEDSEVEI